MLLTVLILACTSMQYGIKLYFWVITPVVSMGYMEKKPLTLVQSGKNLAKISKLLLALSCFLTKLALPWLQYLPFKNRS